MPLGTAHQLFVVLKHPEGPLLIFQVFSFAGMGTGNVAHVSSAIKADPALGYALSS